MSEQADRDTLAEALADDALIEAVGAAIWQANNELTKPEYRNMPDAEARTYFAHAAIDAAFGSDWLAQRDRRVAAEALREAAEELPARTEGTDRSGTATWRPHDRDVYSLVIEEAQSALRERADRIEARP